jgi:hypothetical protein
VVPVCVVVVAPWLPHVAVSVSLFRTLQILLDVVQSDGRLHHHSNTQVVDLYMSCPGGSRPEVAPTPLPLN